jgi:hypothetical protein
MLDRKTRRSCMNFWIEGVGRDDSAPGAASHLGGGTMMEIRPDEIHLDGVPFATKTDDGRWEVASTGHSFGTIGLVPVGT